jgi:two-component system chemotaxis response regulator CheB
MKSIRLLIVDDSPTVQSVLKGVFSKIPDIKVIGVAADAFEARDLIVEKHPDVVTLDVEMPRIDGITFLKRLMSFRPVPVVMISSYTRENSLRTLEALEAGAVDFVAKPVDDIAAGLEALKDEIAAKVRIAARANVKPQVPLGKLQQQVPPPMIRSSNKIVAIGASTGGTHAIHKILRAMPSNINGIVIVQHMPGRFTRSFAQQLDSMLPMDVKEAEDGDRLGRNKVIIAPGGWHLEVAKDPNGYFVRLHDGRPVKRQRPSVDVLFHSVAAAASRNAVGVILTGMGDDGAEGLWVMKRAGAFTVAQDEATCVIFGMPAAAIRRGAVDKVAPLESIPGVIISALES